MTPKKQLFKNNDNQQNETEREIDHDEIDYSTAFRRENQRRQRSQEWMKLNADFYKKSQSVLSDFVYETMDLDGVSKNEVVFDVLPSFEMFTSLQSTTTAQNTVLNTALPPDYIPDENDKNIASAISPEYSGVLPGLVRNLSFPDLVSIPSSSPSFADSATSTSNVSLFDNNVLENDVPFDKNIFDNAHKLPKLKHQDIQVQIYVTKDVPTPYSKCESESMLKEYTSGDVVHGYITVTNRTSRKIPFHMFTVTLEGNISIIDNESKRRVVKPFLNMIDLSASWSFGNISPSANLTYRPGTKDYDGSYLGLRGDRVLEPHSSYKKFFTFKFPYNSLDTTCPHQQELHTLLPPSLGIDTLKSNRKYANIVVNPSLGYGHNSNKGSPIVTKDLSDNLSINYSINAVLVGLNPNEPKSKKLVCLSESEYCLRFIPFGFGVSLFSSKRSFNYLKELIERTFKTAERSLKLTLEGNSQGVEELDRLLKLDQLRLNETSQSTNMENSYNFPLRNEDHATSDFSKVETFLTYVELSSNLFRFKSNYDSNNNGFITITTSLPKDGLPYISPSLIRRTNEISKLNNMGIANYNMMNDSLSNNEKKKLTSINIDLKFTPSDHRDSKSIVEPPKIKLIETNLLVMNVHSTVSVPIKLSSDIFIKNHGGSFKKLKHDFKEYDLRYNELLKDFQRHGLEIERFIPKEIKNDINAMKDLKCDSFLISVLSHNVEGLTKWEKSKSNSSEWIQSLRLNLDFKSQILETLIPTFQSCLISRHYCIQVEIEFKNGQSTSLRVPIRLRQFDGN